MLDTEIKNKVDLWLNGDYDADTKAELKQMLDSGMEEELTDAFYKELEFGTGGLRGIMGVGTNRMNKYTVGAATQGLANYLKTTNDMKEISVAIAYDSRNNSDFFAKTAADILTANGIKVYFFSSLRPTPELSFAVRTFDCNAGIVVTASHNPKEYNGYKVYWQGGAQVVPPHDKNIIAEVGKISQVSQINYAANDNLLEKIDEEVDAAYIKMIKSLSISPDAIQRQKDLKIVFTPIHGTSIVLVPRLLELFGFTNVTVVEEQAEPNGDFPTVIYPNPEEAEANAIALNKAKELDADLVISTDPDADRVGAAVKDLNGDFVLLTGNQTATLLYDYILKAKFESKQLVGNEFTVKTIVTTEILPKIAAKYGVESFDVLTGFKFIAQMIGDLEPDKKYLVGGEESYGYLIGDFVRDKDAISSCALIAEMVAWLKDQGKSPYQHLIDLYVEHGFYKENLISITKKGKSGAEEIQAMMQKWRDNPPSHIAGSKVIKIADYKTGKVNDVVAGITTQTGLPSSNVLQFFTEDGSKITGRPSGTEPKIKFYFGVKDTLNSAADFDKVNKALDAKIGNIIADLELK